MYLYINRRVKALTDAGSVPAVVATGTVRDAVITQQPGPRHFTPQADTADACLQVCCAALTVGTALCRKDTHRKEYIIKLCTDKDQANIRVTLGNMLLVLLYFCYGTTMKCFEKHSLF